MNDTSSGSSSAGGSTTRQLAWDYTELADAYAYRPNYADAAIDRVLEASQIDRNARVIDLGAGTGHLTIKLAARGLRILALEPNARMRAIGMARTEGLANVCWTDGVMTATSLDGGQFDLATYGSSFGVADYPSTLAEAGRILRPGGAVACLFNHRNLADPIQQAVEELIRSELPDFRHGNRRGDQTHYIDASGLFGPVERIDVEFLHEQATADWVAAWSAHATLRQQAGDRFAQILAGISALVAARCAETIRVPYTTRVWIASLRARSHQP